MQKTIQNFIFLLLGISLMPNTLSSQVITQTFTSSGSFSVPCGVTSISVQCWGPGGGGGGDGTNGGNSGSGGGGGGYSTAVIAVTPGTNIAYIIGLGGAGGSGNSNGAAGSANTTFSTVIANFGTGGAFNSGAAGVGGTGTSNNGINGTVGGVGGAASGAGGAGGNGGAGGAGVGGAGVNFNGISGTIPGGAGSGGFDNAGGTVSGGAGARGQITITYTIPSAGPDQTLAACATSTTLNAIVPPAGIGTWTCITNCTGVVITTPNSPTSGVTGLTPGVTTTLRWTASDAGCTSSTDDMTITAPQGPGCWVYCTATDVGTTYFLSNVTIGTINNTTTNTCPNMYCNFTGQSTNVTAGTSINITVTVQTGANAADVYVWFDWNNDGDFTDPGEEYLIGNAPVGTTTLGPISIAVPVGATLGNTRMRVNVQRFDDATAPCGPFASSFGETEDYTVNVLPNPCAHPLPDAGADQTLALCANSTNLAGNAISPGSGVWTLISGMGIITDPSNPATAVTGLGAGANVFQWTSNPPGGCPPDPLIDQVTITTSGIPVVNAGIDQGTCLTSTTMAGSAVPAGATGLWTVSPAGPAFAAAANPLSGVSGMVQGITYTFRWTVTNACGAYFDEMLVVVAATVTPANAGSPQTICPASVTLNGNAPIVGTGTWTFISGPSAPTITDPSLRNTTVSNLIAGSYIFRWTISGTGCVGTSTSDVTITVNNCQNPIIHNAVTDQTYTGCNFIYTDDGGAGGNYTEGVTMTRTIICPDQPNQYVSITFSALDLGATRYDNIIIFTDDDPGTYMYAYADGANETTIPLGTPIVSDQMGECMTIQFSSYDPASTGSGWVASTSCTTVAPPVVPNPYIVPSNCGYRGGYTLCQSETINPPSSFQGGQTELSVAGGVNNGCIGSGETNGTWAYMTVIPQVNPADPVGNIAFDITGANGQDFDFAIWGPYASLECPVYSRDQPIRCSWAATGVGGSGECGSGFTGLGYFSNDGVPQSDVSEPSGACSVPSGINDGYVTPIEAQIGDVYVLFVSNYGLNNATWDFTYTGTANLGCDPPLLLAIGLSNFTGYNAGNHNVLNWTTNFETNSDFFTLEKSTDGISWTILKTVEAAKNSTEPMYYTELDYSPYKPVTYYRVKQTNLDGEKSYSKVIVINKEDYILTSELFPNPAKENFHFTYGGNDFETPIDIEVINAMGQTVLRTYSEKQSHNQQITVEASSLPNGVYYVNISQGQMSTVKKICIVRQ